jgi:hypothetical protein
MTIAHLTDRFTNRLLVAFILGMGLLAAAGPATAQEVDIPYEKFVLDNGLTLIVHEDHKAPIVAVNVWYHVGSKNEKEGKTGFAHLFEHLMFNGSENFNDDYFKPFDRVGATGMNGTTNFDRTNYFRRCRRTRWTWRCGWNRIAWATCWVPSTSRAWTSSAAWCRTRSARARTSPMAKSSPRLSATSTRKGTRIPGRSSATWRISKPPRWRT